jgi:hypothetical protein
VKLKSMRMVANGTLHTQGQTVEVEFDRKLSVPASMRMDINIAKQFDIVIAVVGDAGWQKSPAGVDDIPASQIAPLMLQRWIDPELVLTRHREKDTVVTRLDPTKVDGKAVEVVRLTSPQGFEAVLYIDAATKLVVQSKYPTGGGDETVESFSDYKLVDGIQVAHRRTSKSTAEEAELTVTKVEINPTIDPAIFARPK